MTPLQWFLGFKKVKEQEWLEEQFVALKEKYGSKLAEFEKTCADDISSREQIHKANLLILDKKKQDLDREIKNFENRLVELGHEHKMNMFRAEQDAKLELDKAVMKLEAKHDEVVLDKKQAIKAEEKEVLALEKSRKKLELAQDDIDALIKRAEDKEKELLKKNEELSQQIRLLEAKASPDQVWISAFQSGFSKAWGMMKPVMYEGFDKVKQEISDNAKMETLNGLQSVLRGKDGLDTEKD